MKWWRPSASLASGEWGELLAAEFLRDKGYKVLGHRVRVDRRDELDLVARDGEVLVFVEVKTRRSQQYGRPMDSVDRQKRKVLSRAAVRYMKRLRSPDLYFRFDVVEVIGREEDKAACTVRHVENAFPLDQGYSFP